MRDIGKNIKTVRQGKGMTQDAMAEALYVTRQTISNYENGRSRPDLDMLLRIAEVLGTDVNTILYGPPIPQSKKEIYKWLILSGSILTVVTAIYLVMCDLFPKDSLWGYQLAIRVTNQMTMLPTVMFTLGWFLTHCFSFFGLRQLRGKGIRVVRIVALVILVLLAVIPVPMVVFYGVVAYRMYAYDSVSMVFPYIPVYREAFKVVLYMIAKMPFVYTIFGSITWLLGLPKVINQPQVH